MSSDDVDKLLGLDGPTPRIQSDPTDDARVIAYRDGAQTVEERAAFEMRLSKDTALRQRLFELVDAPADPLQQWAAEHWPTSRKRPWFLYPLGGALAIGLAAMLFMSVRSTTLPPPSLNAPPAFELDPLRGALAFKRGPDAQTKVAVAVARSPLVWVLRASQTPKLGDPRPVAKAFVQRDTGALQSAAVQPHAEGESVFKLAARAGDLLGTQPGTYRVYIVVAMDAAVLERVSSASSLEAENGLRAYSTRIEYRVD